jgi:disulfide bond formation protein DsbB
VFQPRATCADAAVDLIGVPYEFWSLALFLAVEAAALWLFVRARRIAD